MNKSIRSRLFISITLLLSFFIFLLWFMNSQFLNSYYLNKKKSILIDNVNYIKTIYKGSPTDIEIELQKIANTTSCNIEIFNSDGANIYGTGRKIQNNMYPRDLILPSNTKSPFLNKIQPITKDKYSFVSDRDPQSKIDFLVLVSMLNNNDTIYMRVPLLSIKESVDIANNFIIIVGLFVLAIGSIMAFIYAKKFTSPILELNAVAENMAKFDFSKKYKVKGKDEIAHLGNSINYLSSELDKTITELNIKNQKLQEDIEKERKIDEMRKELISSISHELRTPISIIQGYSEGLVCNIAESTEDKNFYCNVIMEETTKMNKLVKDLLNLSQMESGYLSLEETDFNIDSLIEHILNKYSNTFKEKNINIEFNSKFNLDHEITAYGDLLRVEQVITNFITNAINHIDGDRKLVVTREVIEDKIRVFVYNTGKNIPQDSLEKIWTSFYKVDKARTRAYGGYGLGLSIVKAIQELSHNKYGVENKEGGVGFWFDIDKSINDTK